MPGFGGPRYAPAQFATGIHRKPLDHTDHRYEATVKIYSNQMVVGLGFRHKGYMITAPHILNQPFQVDGQDRPTVIRSKTCDAALVKLGSYHQSSISHDEPFGFCQVIHRDFNNDLQESEAHIIDEGNVVSNQYKLEGLKLFKTDSGAPIFKNNQFIGIAIYKDENNITFIPISQMSEILNQITENTPSHHLRPVGPGSINDNGELFDDGSGEYLSYRNLEDIKAAANITIEPIILSHQTLIEVDDYFKNNGFVYKGHVFKNNENDQFNEFFNDFMNKISSMSNTQVKNYNEEITEGIKQLLNDPVEITDCPYLFKIDNNTFYLPSHTGGHVNTNSWPNCNERHNPLFKQNLMTAKNIALAVKTMESIPEDTINKIAIDESDHITVRFSESVIDTGDHYEANKFPYVTVQISRVEEHTYITHFTPNDKERKCINDKFELPTLEIKPTKNSDYAHGR